MKQFILIFLILLNLTCFSQSDKAASFKGAYNVYPIDTLGVVLLNRNMVQLSSGDLALEYLGLNNALKQTWKNMYPFSEGMSPVFQEVSTNGIILLFADNSGKRYELIKANPEYGDYERFKYTFSDKVQILELETFYDHVWVAGLIGDNSVIFKLKPDNTFETLPIGVSGNVSYAGRIAFDKQTKGLNFLILADIQRSQNVVWRSIGLDGEVLQNQLLASGAKKTLKTIKATYDNNHAYLTGTYSIGSRERVSGLFWGVISDDQKEFRFNEFKSIEGLVSYKKANGVDQLGFAEAKKNKFKVSNMSVFVDGINIDSKGKLSIALEVYKPEFRSRGALEKEVIARDRTAQIDRNVYGRQDALGTTLDLEGRFERASATDQLQMRFMDQSLSKAVNQGVSYNHTAFLKVSTALQLEDSKGLAFNLTDFGRLTRKTNLSGDRLVYPYGQRYQVFDFNNNTFKTIDFPESTGVLNWTSDRYLTTVFDKETRTLSLSIQRLN